jgi:hypothetical protein
MRRKSHDQGMTSWRGVQRPQSLKPARYDEARL